MAGGKGAGKGATHTLDTYIHTYIHTYISSTGMRRHGALGPPLQPSGQELVCEESRAGPGRAGPTDLVVHIDDAGEDARQLRRQQPVVQPRLPPPPPPPPSPLP
jgi:hypothetical protein